jgi:hypothetical protein
MDRQLKLWLRVVNFWWRRSLRKDKKLRRLWLSHLSTVSSNREIHHRLKNLKRPKLPSFKKLKSNSSKSTRLALEINPG